jgi:monoterpene epsilon-lactone hydrolase
VTGLAAAHSFLVNAPSSASLARDTVDKRRESHNDLLMMTDAMMTDSPVLPGITTINGRRASLAAELVRLGGRWLLKHHGRNDTTIEQKRRRAAAVERLVPSPPPETRTLAVDANGVEAYRISTPASQCGRHVLFLHGGGFIIGSSSLYRHFTWRIATAARASVLSVDYRLAPENPFPAALDDALAAYHWLLADGADPRRTTVMGDSAGGGLTLSLLLKLRDTGLPLPAAAAAISPWTDLALSGLSFEANARSDPLISTEQARRFVECYLAGADPRTPYASPLYGEPAGLPPTLIQVGSDEVLRDDAVRMARGMRAAGCRVTLEIWPRMPHVWHLFAPIMPEARRAIDRIGTFMIGATRPPHPSPAERPGSRQPAEFAAAR